MTLNTNVKLEPQERRTAAALMDEITEDPGAAAFELVALRKVTRLASELCTAFDRAEVDIGGSRRIKDILADLGPACDAVGEIDG